MDNEKFLVEEVFPKGPRIPGVPENFFTLITTFRDQLFDRSRFKSEDLDLDTRRAVLCIEEALQSISNNTFYDARIIDDMNTLSKGKHLTNGEIQTEIERAQQEIVKFSDELKTMYDKEKPYETLRELHYKLVSEKNALHGVIVMNIVDKRKNNGEIEEEELLTNQIVYIEELINREIELVRKRKLLHKLIKEHKEILKIRKYYGNWQDALKRYWEQEKELYILWCNKMQDKGYWDDYMQLAFDLGYLA